MKLKALLIAAISIAVLAAGPAYAGKDPRPGSADSRIKTFTYHETEVYQLKGHYGFSTVIEFSPREHIETVSMGDSEAWQVLPTKSRPNILLIKPLEENAQTNMTVMTTKRIYTFDLTASKAVSHRSPELAFRIRFVYPEETDLELANFGSMTSAHYDPLQGTDGSDWNFDYSYSGDKRLRPKRAFDDGVFTYFQFEDFEVMPAIFAVDEKGNESLVNYNIQGDYLVVNRVGAQYTLRDGDTATCIFNDAYPVTTGKEPDVVPLAEIEEKTVKVASVPIPPQKPNFDTAAADNESGFFSRLANNFEPVDSNNLN